MAAKKTTEVPIVVSEHQALQANARSYTVGFILSIVMTLLAYSLVVHHSLTRAAIIASISLLAILQFLTQVFFFLHVGEETKPRLKLFMLLFMVMIVLIIVLGSVWIMNNLNYNMRMSPQEIKTFMHANEGL